jgi:monovalent cation:H+ antiporter-2, CPA2 family
LAALPQIYVDAVVLLGGAVVAAPLFKQIGLGTVLGYLAAGVVLGPLTRFITDSQEVLHFSELGVVMLLFIIGLELKPSRLWNMRVDIFGMGLTQVVATGIVTSLAGLLVFDSWRESLVAGFAFALSSTAFAMQVLEQGGDTNRLYGRKAFAILLLQDLAIVPLLALLPLLATAGGESAGIESFALALLAVLAVVLAGRYLINPFFNIIARAGAREVMIAAALLIVCGSALLMAYAGLSMALGAFLAGVLLAESTYRHELEADIEPFRGLLLGLFFMAIGMSLDLATVLSQWPLILVIVPVSMLLKGLCVYTAARLFATPHPDAARVAGVLTQHGEFAFVLFSAALTLGIVSDTFASTMIAAVILSMALTPLSVRIASLIADRRQEELPQEDFAGAGSPVLIVGFSRMAQIATQPLLASGVDVTIIDNDPDRIRTAARFGFRIYFGDGTRPEVLRAAGIEKSALVAVTTGNAEATTKIARLIRSEWPQLPVHVRAYDRVHALELMAMDVNSAVRETFESSLVLGAKMLEGLGLPRQDVDEVISDTRRRDEERLAMQASEGLQAGRHMMLTSPVRPEPLVAPKGLGEALDARSREVLAQGDDKPKTDPVTAGPPVERKKKTERKR